MPVSVDTICCPKVAAQMALLARVATTDIARRTRAVLTFVSYRLLANGDLLNTKNGEVYSPQRFTERPGFVPHFVGCSCPDCEKTVAPLLSAMEKASCGAPCACKHHYIRLLLTGQAVRIGRSVYRAKVAK